MTSILVCDPDRRDATAMCAAMRYGGYRPLRVGSPGQIVRLVRRRALAAVIVDPAGSDGVALVESIRRCSDVPVIVLSAPVGDVEVVSLLDAGADEVLEKPIVVDFLLAHVRAVLRRAVRSAEQAAVETPDFVIDPEARRLQRVDGSEVRLTPTEWRLVAALVRRPGRVVSQRQLLEEVWGSEAVEKTEYLRVQIRAVRRKVEPDPSHPRYFVTLPALGLLFEPQGLGG